MTAALATKAYRADHGVTDPKKQIMDDLAGWLDDVEPTGADFLVCVYERPQKMAGTTLIMPETASRLVEDKFQGTVGLIVKAGPNVEQYAEFFPAGQMPKIGDWVASRVMDTTPFTCGSRAMRIVQANFVRMILKSPDCII